MASYRIVRAATEALLKILQNEFAADNPAIVNASDIKTAPPDGAETVIVPTILLYLYEVLESPSLRNSGPRAVATTPGSVTVARDPLALDLHYLLIPLAPATQTADTHELLGRAMKAFHDNGIFCPGALGVGELNAEDAKLEFRLTLSPLPTSDVIRLWEAVQQKYRLSVAYVVRTVLIDSELKTDTKLVSERRFVTSGG